MSEIDLAQSFDYTSNIEDFDYFFKIVLIGISQW